MLQFHKPVPTSVLIACLLRALNVRTLLPYDFRVLYLRFVQAHMVPTASVQYHYHWGYDELLTCELLATIISEHLYSDQQSTLHLGMCISTWKLHSFPWWRKPCGTWWIILGTHIVLAPRSDFSNIGPLTWAWICSLAICDQSNRWVKGFRCPLPRASITEASCFRHACVYFHPFQHPSHMTLVLLAKTFMAKLKGVWSCCNINFCRLSWDHNAHIHGVCIRHPPACCHELTVALKQPVDILWRHYFMFSHTLYPEQVSSNIGDIPHVFQVVRAPLVLYQHLDINSTKLTSQ